MDERDYGGGVTMRNSQPCDAAAAVAAVGPVYRLCNRGESVFDVLDGVQRICPHGWRAWLAIPSISPAPSGSVRVGSVRVRAHDPAYPLVIYPTITPEEG